MFLLLRGSTPRGGGRKIRGVGGGWSENSPATANLAAHSLRFFSPVNFGAHTDLVIFATDNSTGTRTLNLAKSMKLYSGVFFRFVHSQDARSLCFFIIILKSQGHGCNFFLRNAFCLIFLLFRLKLFKLFFALFCILCV